MEPDTKGVYFADFFTSYKEIKSGSNRYASASNFQRRIIGFIRKWFEEQSEFLLHTSGSTGKPKEILILKKQMEASALATDSVLNLANMKAALLCMNPEFVGGRMMLVRAIIFNWDIIVVSPQANPFETLKNYSYPNNIDFLALTPYQMKAVLQSSNKDVLEQFQAIILGGAPVDWALRQDLQNISAPTYATYGMTETVSHIALQRLNGESQSEYFQILEEVEIRQDDRSCLEIKAPVTLDKWIVTNDIVELLDSQRFKWLGRADNVVNSGGIKIQIEEVEKIIEKEFYKLNIKNRFFLAGIPNSNFGQILILFIEGKVNFSETDFLASIKTTLGKYKTPKQVYYLDKFLETATGKVNRQKNLEQVQSQFSI